MKHLSSSANTRILRNLDPTQAIAFESLKASIAVVDTAMKYGYIDRDLAFTGKPVAKNKKGRVPGYQKDAVSGFEDIAEEIQFLKGRAAKRCLEALGLEDLNGSDLVRELRPMKRRRSHPEESGIRAKLDQLPRSAIVIYMAMTDGDDGGHYRASDLAALCGVSRPTAYSGANALVAAGIALEIPGRRCKKFTLA